jgi:hypothetical protein
MDSRRPSKAEQVMYLLTALLTLAAVAWQMIPQHERQLMGMRLLAGLRDLAGGVAAAQGHEGMASELRGRRGEAGRFYKAAFALSCWRDRLTVTLERMRG